MVFVQYGRDLFEKKISCVFGVELWSSFKFQVMDGLSSIVLIWTKTIKPTGLAFYYLP